MIPQIQVGATDLVATCSAARSAWGWLGGFAGVRHILAHIETPFLTGKMSDIFRSPMRLPTMCGILTFQGLVYLPEELTEDAFGGDPRTQLFGLTICALAHECGGEEAVHVFMKCLAPFLFPKPNKIIPGIREALYGQLLDNYGIILNEGSARKLDARFIEAVTNLRLPYCYQDYNKLYQDPEANGPFAAEIAMVGSFLKWLGRQEEGPYFTRSCMVARVAACLKAVGYIMGQIRVWDGKDSPPAISGGIILVIGGSMEIGGSVVTDPYVLDFEELEEPNYIAHYRFSTVGALLLNALHRPCEILPESLQTWFDKVRDIIETSLDFRWEWPAARHHQKLKIMSVWKLSPSKSASWLVRLASLEFPNFAQHITPCYELVGSEEMLEVVLKAKDYRASRAALPTELVKYRIITACILLSIIGKLGGTEFGSLQHATTLDLSNHSQWMAKATRYVNKGILHGFSIPTAVILIATIHCGLSYKSLEEDLVVENAGEIIDRRVIGWRNGTYCVVPSLLFALKPTPESLGFRCADIFICNLPVHKTGSVRSGHERRMILQGPSPTGQGLLLPPAESRSERPCPIFDSPVAAVPDVPLCINIEKTFHTQDPDLCLCGRVGGNVIGIVGVLEVLETLVRNLGSQAACPGHDSLPIAEIMRASYWANNVWIRDRMLSRSKPCSTPHIYVPVKDDHCWALFLAGFLPSSQAVISHGCFDCTVKQRSTAFSRNGELVVIGYQ